MTSKNNNVGHYILEKKIGHGAFAKVELATHEYLNLKVAIKIISRKKISVDVNFARCLNEINIYKELNHKNVIKMFEVLRSANYLYIVMEYAAGGDLYTLLNNKTRLSETETRFYFRQIINGLEYIHTQGYSHRDLKLENILLTDQNQIKIADFGLSNKFVEGKLMETSCGSLRYATPEILKGKKYSGELADVWSCGIIMFTLLAGYHPFDDEVYGMILKKIMKSNYAMPTDISSQAVDLIKRILEVL
jgi:serine/threonine protein kinase